MPTACLDPGCFAVIDNDYAVFYLIHIMAIVSLTLSFFASAYIIWRCLFIDKRYSKIGHRFPIYLSAFDLILSITHSLDHWIIMFSQHFPQASLSAALGACLHLFLGSPALVVSVISVSLYLNMFHQWKINFGRYDFALFSICVGLPLIQVIIGLQFGAFGKP